MVTQDDFPLQSERLLIRRWQRLDYTTMDQWPVFTDPLSVVWNLPDRIIVGQREWLPDYRRTFAIETHAHELIGRLTLRDIDIKRTSARLGITIGAPYVGQRYGTEAMTCFLDAFFSTMRFQTMVLDVAALNERAVRCYRGLGFQQTGMHWRDGGNRFFQLLSPETRESITPYVRHGRNSVWVQFYDMQLAREDWYNRRRQSTTSFV